MLRAVTFFNQMLIVTCAVISCVTNHSRDPSRNRPYKRINGSGPPHDCKSVPD